MPDRMTSVQPDVSRVGQRRQRLPLRQYAVPAAVLCAGVLLSLALFAAVRSWEQGQITHRFEAAVNNRTSTLKKELEADELVVQALVSFYDGTQEVERGEFTAFAPAFLAWQPDIRALEWVPRVRAAEVAAYEARARKEGLPGFRITEVTEGGAVAVAGEREEYFPVFFAAPYRGNSTALGLDLASEPSRRQALLLARDTGSMAATGRIALVQGKADESGFLIVAPIYAKGAAKATVEDRRASLEGFVLAVFQFKVFAEEVFKRLSPAGIDVHFFDESAPAGRQHFYSHWSRMRDGPSPPAPETPDAVQADLREDATLALPQRNVRMVLAAAPAFAANGMARECWLALAAGLVVTSLLTVYLVSLKRHAGRTEMLAAQLMATNRSLEEQSATRKRAEEELKKAHAFTESTLHCISDIFYAFDTTGRFLRWNEAFRRVTGYDETELASMKPEDFFPPEDRQRLVETIEQMWREGSAKVEADLVLKDGMAVPYEFNGSVLKDGGGNILGFSGTGRDLSDRKRMEHELRRLAVIAEQAAEGIAVADLDGNLQFVNDAWARMHGYESGAELAGKHLRVFHTDEQFKTEVVPFNATVRRQGHHSGEVGHVRKDGSTFPTQMSVVILKDEQGEPYGLAGFAEDITNRKRAEEELLQTNRQLEIATDRANKMAAEAEYANAAKSAFLANMSHEIRTPMTAILGFTEIIGSSLECCVTCPEHQACPTRVQNKESIQIIRRNGEHLLELINDILDISKIEAGKFVMDVQECSMPALVADVVSMMRVRAEQHNISLSVEYETEIPETVRTDGARVRQALVNLVGNAVKFTERGGVRVVASFLPAWRDGQSAVRVRVIDTGLGIGEEKLAQLFQPFVQADASTSRKYGGTGLGLAISRRFAELLGGELAVESTVGKGSTFTLTIPTGSLEGVRMLKNPAEAVHGEATGLHVPAVGEKILAGTRILVAEDGPDNQRLIRTILSMAGAQVELAADGREAVSKASAGSFDMVLMDMQMPEMDGYEATRLLRSQGYGVPILALTAHAITGDREKCLAAGCTDHLTKPIDRGRLIDAVARYAGKVVPGEGQAAPTPESPAGDPEVIRSQYADDPELAGVLDQFVQGLPGQIEAMSLAAQAGLWEELRRLAHRLKGAGGSYGYPSLTEAARGLEEAARAGDVEAAGMALGRLTALSRAVVKGATSEPVSKEMTS